MTDRKPPTMPDRWARVYDNYTANPSWSRVADALEPQQGAHVAVVRYVAVPGSIVWLDEVQP